MAYLEQLQKMQDAQHQEIKVLKETMDDQRNKINYLKVERDTQREEINNLKKRSWRTTPMSRWPRRASRCPQARRAAMRSTTPRRAATRQA